METRKCRNMNLHAYQSLQWIRLIAGRNDVVEKATPLVLIGIGVFRK